MAEGFEKPRFYQKPEPHLDVEAVHRSGGFVVVQPHVDRFPTEVRDTGFEELPPEVRATYLLGLTAACRNYYGGYVVRDPFNGDEDKRLAWQTHMLREHGEQYDTFQKRSKLRIAPIQSMFGLFHSFVQQLDEHHVHTPQAERVRELEKQLPVIENVAPKTEFSGIPDGLAARLRAALATTDGNPGDAAEFQRLKDSSWKMMSFEKKVEVSRAIDEIAAAFLELVTAQNNAPETTSSEKL